MLAAVVVTKKTQKKSAHTTTTATQKRIQHIKRMHATVFGIKKSINNNNTETHTSYQTTVGCDRGDKKIHTTTTPTHKRIHHTKRLM